MKNIVQKAIYLLLVVGLMSCSHTRAIGKTDKQANPLAVSYQLSYEAGYVDVNNNWIGGTETMNIVEHKGKLYAGVGYWMDLPYGEAKGNDPWTGSQALVKDSDETPWRLDANLGESTGRSEALLSAIFITDKLGKSLDKPINMLVTSALDAYQKTLYVWSRDDETNLWVKIKVADTKKSEGARSLGFHQDKVTNVSMIFAGSSGGEIFSGVYDKTVPGKLTWNSVPELVDRDGRAMAFTEANGEIYCSVGRTLYKRIDGIKPVWISVYHWTTPKPFQNYNNTIMRGLTTIKNPNGTGEVILAARENPGLIERIDPAKNHKVTVEINVADYFTNLWGVKKRGCLMAYNDMAPFSIPGTDTTVHLIGLQMHHPDRTIDRKTGYYMVRWPDGSYTHGEMHDPTLSDHPEPRAIRCFRESPWKKGEFFAGGFDCNGKKSHNTAWMMKGTVNQKNSEKEKKYATYEKYTDISYLKTDSDPNLTSLDVYTPDLKANLPVVVWIHGGGWRNGDKKSIAGFPKFLCSEGFIFVSVNYRLSPEAIFPQHAQDVASAITWVYHHISEYGGDPHRINLAGHSAGAHLTALLACNEELLGEYQLSLSHLRTATSVDTRVYDLESVAKLSGGKLLPLYGNIFTQDPEKWKAASPAYYVNSEKENPPMLIFVSRGTKEDLNPDRIMLAEEFQTKLQDAGKEALCCYFPEKDHMEIAIALFDSEDPVSIAFLAFLKKHNDIS